LAATPRISVIVAVYNEAQHLDRCLRTLLAQRYPGVEVIVVDDGSQDATLVIAARYPVMLLSQPHRGPALARNLGARHATGEILAFVDGDMHFAPDFLEALTRPIRDGRAVGSFTKEILIGNVANPWSRCWAYHRGTRPDRPDRHLPDDLPDEWGNYRAIRRDAFWSVGGYDDVGYGEDMTVWHKLRMPAIAAPGALCWHWNPSTAREVFENARWIGRGERVREIPGVLFRYSLPQALVHGFSVAIREGWPRFLLFKLMYNAGVSLGYLESTVRRGRHWK
jgi:glycosyltransferase involved in cell wall biosynthesis